MIYDIAQYSNFHLKSASSLVWVKMQHPWPSSLTLVVSWAGWVTLSGMIVFVRPRHQRLSALARIAPRFAAHSLTAAASLKRGHGKRGRRPKSAVAFVCDIILSLLLLPTDLCSILDDLLIQIRPFLHKQKIQKLFQARVNPKGCGGWGAKSAHRPGDCLPFHTKAT